MGTTDTRLATTLLRELDGMGSRYGVLHCASEIAAERPISDVDTVIDRDPWGVLKYLASQLRSHQLRLTMVWEYDFGAVTSFWTSKDGLVGAQLDLLSDPPGRGRYGLRTDVALRHLDEGTRSWPPRLSDEASVVYLLSKRIVKGDYSRAQNEAGKLSSRCSYESAVALISSLLSPRCAKQAIGALSGRFPRPSQSAVILWRQRCNLRGLRRLIEPTGAAVHLSCTDLNYAESLRQHLAEIFARVAIVGQRDYFGRVRAQLSIRQPVVLLVVTDIALGANTGICMSGDLADDLTRITAELEAITRRRLSRRWRCGSIEVS